MSREGGYRVMEPLLGNKRGASEPMSVSTKQQRIAKLAKQSPQMGFTSLNHYLDEEWMREAFRRIRKKSSPGADGVTVGEYGRNLGFAACVSERVCQVRS